MHPNCRVRVSDTGRERLIELHDTLGLTWREIATLEEYEPVPPGTLCTYAKDGYLPPKWRYKFRKPRPRRVAVHTINIGSAVNTLLENFEPNFIWEVCENVLEELKNRQVTRVMEITWRMKHEPKQE